MLQNECNEAQNLNQSPLPGYDLGTGKTLDASVLIMTCLIRAIHNQLLPEERRCSQKVSLPQ